MRQSPEEIISKYMAKIGRKGGKRGKRTLSTEAAQKMVAIREAKRAYKKFFTECFWSFDPELKITADDVNWVGEQLMKHGSMECWKIGRRLCQ